MELSINVVNRRARFRDTGSIGWCWARCVRFRAPPLLLPHRMLLNRMRTHGLLAGLGQDLHAAGPFGLQAPTSTHVGAAVVVVCVGKGVGNRDGIVNWEKRKHSRD